ncbi:hypothetical protein V1515DRAFT_583246, partial [Lipomyces mesembrius]
MPPWMSTLLLLASFGARLTDARMRPIVPPPAAILEAEGINPLAQPFAAPVLGVAAPVLGVALPRAGWTATADSTQDVNVANNVLDGNTTTMWHTEWAPTGAPLPHTITIDMNAVN